MNFQFLGVRKDVLGRGPTGPRWEDGQPAGRWAPAEGAGRLLDAVLVGIPSRVGAARRLAAVGLLLRWRRPAKRFQAFRRRWLGGVWCSATWS